MKLALPTLAALLIASPLLAADSDTEITTTRTENVPLASPGTVTIDKTWGEVVVEGWDKPSVEVTVTARSKKAYSQAQTAEMRERLARFGFEAKAVSASQVAVTGVSPNASLLKPFGGKSGVSVHYTIHMPRAAKLVMHHDVGEVAIKQLDGDVDANARVGDLSLALGLDQDAAVDGSAGIGDVSVKPPLGAKGTSKRHMLVGQTFSYHPATTPRRRIVAHVGIGEVSID